MVLQGGKGGQKWPPTSVDVKISGGSKKDT